VSFKSWLHKWKAVGAILGISGKTNKAVEDAGKFAKKHGENAIKDEAGDPRYEGGYKDATTGETISQAVGQSIAHGEGEDE